MRKTFALLLSMFFVLAVQVAAWELDPVHSSVQFVVTHLTISKVHGEFTDFAGDLTFDGTNLKDGKVTFTIKATSVSTGNSHRDDDLRSDNFFNVEKYPEITFKSKQVIPGDGSKFKLVGDLTIRDVTKEVAFDCEYNGTVKGNRGDVHAGFSAASMINRQDFKVAFNRALEGGGLVVGNDVKLALELEFVQMPQEKPAGK